MKINPIGEWFVAKKVEELTEEKDGGIIIPHNTTREKHKLVEVISVGPGKYHNGEYIPMEVKVGEKLMIHQHGGIEVKIDEEKFIILREQEVLYKVEE